MERVLKSRPLWGKHKLAQHRGGQLLDEREPGARLVGYSITDMQATIAVHNVLWVVLQRPNGDLVAYFWDVGSCVSCGLSYLPHDDEKWKRICVGRIYMSRKRAFMLLLGGQARSQGCEGWVLKIASKAGVL